MAHSDFADTRRFLAIRDKARANGEYVGVQVYKARPKPQPVTPKPQSRKTAKPQAKSLAEKWEAERMAKLANAYKVEDTTRALKSVGNGL